jgi:hypothetical protein
MMDCGYVCLLRIDEDLCGGLIDHRAYTTDEIRKMLEISDERVIWFGIEQ